MLKVKKSPGEWSAATGSAWVSFCVSVLQEGCCRYRIKYYVHLGVPGSEHPGGHFTRGRVLSSSPHWWALYFFTSAMYLAHASPLLVNTSSSVFCFLATIPVLRASLFPPLRLPTWVKGQKTARVTGAGPALGGAEAHYTFLATPRPAPPDGRRS